MYISMYTYILTHTYTHASPLSKPGGEDGAVRAWDPRSPGDGQAAAVHDPWAGPVGGSGSSSGGDKSQSQALLQGSKWIAALAADPGGNFAVCGGGVEQAGVGKQGFVSVFHLPSMAVVASAATPSFVQDVCFLEDKVRSSELVFISLCIYIYILTPPLPQKTRRSSLRATRRQSRTGPAPGWRPPRASRRICPRSSLSTPGRAPHRGMG